MVAVVALLSSCDKSDEPVVVPLKSEAGVALPAELRSNPVVESVGVSEDILRYFRHHSQRDNNENAPDYCCPTSFMMSVACLLNYHDAWNAFSVSRQKLSEFAQAGVPDAVYNNVNQENFVENAYPNIEVDVFLLNDRNATKSMIEYGLRNEQFVIVSARTYIGRAGQDRFFSTDDSENYDLRLPASTATSTTRRYVMDHGGTSHALIILRIDKWSSGNGIVTYIDPYHYTRRGKSNRKYCLYSHLLNSMNRSDLMEKDANYKRYNFALVGYKQD